MNTVAALFCHRRSPYKSLPGVDCYDAARDARTFPGGLPVVAHPPCRYWSRARRPGLPVDESERSLAPWAVSIVRRWGGVLEHPYCSRLWAAMDLPSPGTYDNNGFTVQIDQRWFGHRAEKATWLYVCGLLHEELPEIHFNPWFRPVNFHNLSRAQRQLTPAFLASWLVDVARQCTVAPSADLRADAVAGWR